MSSLLIEGGRPISGTIEVEGNKNAALPLLAACLLTTEECVLTNMPRIGDVGVMAKLLEEIGAEVHGLGTTTVRVRCRNITTSEPSSELVGMAVGNLLRNACQYTDEGEIVVRLRAGLIVIEDTGPGMPPAVRGRLFERFVRGTDAEGQGAGLGLAIAKRIVEHLDWKIGLEERDGRGSRFVLSFPN